MPDVRPPDTEKTYEKAAIRKAQLQMAQRILRELALDENSFVLDAGCGSGFSMESALAVSKSVHENPADCTKNLKFFGIPKNKKVFRGFRHAEKRSFSCIFGFDISPELLLVAKRKGIKNLVRADFAAVPFGENIFDAIISVSAIQWFNPKDEHDVKDHYAQIAKEFFRLLKSGGKAGLQFYPATEREWEIAVKCFRKLFGGYIIEEGERRKRKRYLILEKK